jgi:hypothetical protein
MQPWPVRWHTFISFILGDPGMFYLGGFTLAYHGLEDFLA